MTAIRLLIGDNQGLLIGEVEAAIGPVSWRLNQVGRVQLQLGTRDEKAREVYFEYGNRVLIQFDNGLPDWGGTIDPPREWSPGMVQATAYSADYILGQRTTDQGRYFSGDSVGYIYRKLIEETNDLAPTGITIGTVWGGGAGHFPDYHLDNLLKIIQESVCGRLSTAEYEIAGGVSSGGRIVFTANLYERMGEDKPQIALVEDKNVVEAKVSEQGPITNYWSLAGSGNGWADDRLLCYAEDKASQGRYGLRMDAAVFNDVSILETLEGHAADLLAATKSPVVVFDLTVSDADPGKFAEYRVGDRVYLDLPSYGFEGVGQLVRVVGREYNPSTGFCRLVVEG